ncbi:hypothetical protein GCM10017778_30900 [Streptomyces vinaceus]|nr:hypothetical protein GCM10017778_30900 [Streptomyces vinaceus]
MRGGAPSEALAALPPDTTNATAANVLISARFISHALRMIARFWSGRSLGRDGLGGNGPRQEPGAAHAEIPAPSALDAGRG